MKFLHIAAYLLALLTDVDHSSPVGIATATKTNKYETKYETISKQEDDDAGVADAPLPTLLRGATKAVYQFLSDGDGDREELACSSNDECSSNHCENGTCCWAQGVPGCSGSGLHCCDSNKICYPYGCA